jgi:hypothetical protein
MGHWLARQYLLDTKLTQLVIVSGVVCLQAAYEDAGAQEEEEGAEQAGRPPPDPSKLAEAREARKRLRLAATAQQPGVRCVMLPGTSSV